MYFWMALGMGITFGGMACSSPGKQRLLGLLFFIGAFFVAIDGSAAGDGHGDAIRQLSVLGFTLAFVFFKLASLQSNERALTRAVKILSERVYAGQKNGITIDWDEDSNNVVLIEHINPKPLHPFLKALEPPIMKSFDFFSNQRNRWLILLGFFAACLVIIFIGNSIQPK